MAAERQQLQRLGRARGLAVQRALRLAQQLRRLLGRAALDRQASAVERRRRGQVEAAGGLRLVVAAGEGLGGDVEIAGGPLEVAEIVQGGGDQPRITALPQRGARSALEREASLLLQSGREVGLPQQAIERGRPGRILLEVVGGPELQQPVERQPVAPFAQIRLGLAQTLVEHIRQHRPGQRHGQHEQRQQPTRQPSPPISRALAHGRMLARGRAPDQPCRTCSGAGEDRRPLLEECPAALDIVLAGEAGLDQPGAAREVALLGVLKTSPTIALTEPTVSGALRVMVSA